MRRSLIRRSASCLAVVCICAGVAATTSGCASTAQIDAPDGRMTIAQVRKELVAMGQADQAVRSADTDAMDSDERLAFFEHARAQNREHTARLKQIIARYGWPGTTRFGERAALSAFLIVQHSDHDPRFQLDCLPLMRAAAQRGEADPANVAFLTDRARVKLGRPQVYGTQYDVVRDEQGHVVVDDQGRPQYLPPMVEDPATLDERRLAAGLEPWIEYERRMAKLHERDLFDQPLAPESRTTAATPEH